MTDQLIFVHDKRRDAYVDKTSEIVGLRPAGAYVYVDYGAARVFRYRKEHTLFAAASISDARISFCC